MAGLGVDLGVAVEPHRARLEEDRAVHRADLAVKAEVVAWRIG